jgi:CHAD domain-containing protein
VISRELSNKRAAALAQAQTAVTSARFRRVLLDIAAWLETGNWTEPADDLVRDRGGVAVETIAVEQLARRYHKVRKKAKALARLDARRRHKLRIQVKKLRYAAEFFGSLFPGKRATKRREKFLCALEALQDGLGDLNDIVVDENTISRLGLRSRQSNAKRAFAAGLLTGREDAQRDAAMAAAAAAGAALAKVKPFWR